MDDKKPMSSDSTVIAIDLSDLNNFISFIDPQNSNTKFDSIGDGGGDKEK